jgi:hypothetical protein
MPVVTESVTPQEINKSNHEMSLISMGMEGWVQIGELGNSKGVYTASDDMASHI